ncbi:MAG: DNA mismatch repair endonuclease MutL [Treponema sp.]|jgi:DNA mismatch repair protein MutL|nr:DNA mismatch repair endonuclease MutL [Treponema sp.]
MAGRIAILPPEEARKIAAGEVIDRPAALVRELLDNAIDSGCSSAEVLIEEGGIRRTEVIDDGSGMGKEDLELCWETHATSKIRSLADLSTAETLGFRGEALSAAAAVSRLEILSSVDGREAWLLEAGPGGKPGQYRIAQARRVKGSSVRSIGLFDAIPARKRFLKREGTEAGLCRQIFIEKALAFPEINFRFTQDGKLKCFLPAASSLKDRFAQALLDRKEASFLHEIAAAGEGFSAVIVFGGPELYRSERRQQYIFANGRRIQDYGLLQAFEYGQEHLFPNGTHPVGAVFIDIDPGLADFNIHPAKREARFRDPQSIHHAITSALRDYTRRILPGGDAETEDGAGSRAFAAGRAAGGQLAMEALLNDPPVFAPFPRFASPSAPEGGSFPWEGLAVHEEAPPYGAAAEEAPRYPEPTEKPRFIGRLFSLFILVEKGDRLFIIDQHAAHERLLYDRFLKGPIPTQELLVPIPFTAEDEGADRFLDVKREELANLGVRIDSDAGSWHITALPSNWKLSDRETVKAILELEKAGKNMAEHWAATVSCHGAVKDGDLLDDGAALALAEAAMELSVPRCPHGRPLWKEIGREELFRAVRRIE